MCFSCKKNDLKQATNESLANLNENNQKKKNTENLKKTIKRDTLIPLTNDVKLYFHQFDETQKLWKIPKLIKNDKDTINIKNWDNEWGSELDIRLSPNKRYMVLDAIIKGFLNNNKEELYENYTCQLIDIYNSKDLDSFQEYCGGEWNKNNEWISNEEVIFTGKNTTTSNLFVAQDCLNSRFSIEIIDIHSILTFKIFDKTKIILKGIINIDKKQTPNTINLGKIGGIYYGDSIVIQNYGNSINEYNHFIQCNQKYVTFVKD